MESETFNVLIGVLLGGLLTVGTTILLERYRESREARRLAKAFCGEISALKHIVERRQYIAGLGSVLKYIDETGQTYSWSIRVRRRYFGVYESNLDRIGLLEGVLPEQIASFYVRANSILEDLSAIDDGLWSDKGAAEQRELYAELKSLFEELMEDAEALIREIKGMYP